MHTCTHVSGRSSEFGADDLHAPSIRIEFGLRSAYRFTFGWISISYRVLIANVSLESHRKHVTVEINIAISVGCSYPIIWIWFLFLAVFCYNSDAMFRMGMSDYDVGLSFFLFGRVTINHFLRNSIWTIPIFATYGATPF